jgi:hypothetical protein
MKACRATVLLGTLAWASATASSPPAASRPGRSDIVYSTEVATPHVAWATRLPGGPIRGFFIPSVAHGRDMVELMQRLALQPTTVTIDPSWDVNCWGIGDFYGHETRGDRDDFRIVYGYVEQDLTGSTPFEVLVIPGLNGWSRLTRPSRDAILRRVREGAGLVLLHPFVGDVKGHPFKGDEAEGDTRIWELSPLANVPDDRVNDRGYPEPNAEAITQARWEVTGRHFITDAIDLGLIPSGPRGGRFYRYEARGDVLVQAGGHPVVAAKAYGKGRVVAFAYVGDGFVPEPVDPIATRTYWDYWEYQYALLAKTVLWAAGREAGVRVTGLRASSEEGLRLTLSKVPAARAKGTVVPSPGTTAQPGPSPRTSRGVEIEVGVKSEVGLAFSHRRIQKDLPEGETVVAVPTANLRPEAGWPGGRTILDVIVRDAASGATLDWGFTSFEVPRPAAVTGIRTNASVYRQGETMSIVTRAAGDLEGLRMRVRLTDDLGRVLHAEEKTTAGERYFFYGLDDFVGRSVQIIAELVDGRGRVVDQLRREPLIVVPVERRVKEYAAQMTFENPPHYLAALRRRRLRAEGMASGFTWGGDVNDELNIPRGYFGVYWYDRGPTTPEAMEKAIVEFQRTQDFDALAYLTKKELFKRTGDKRFLVRRPCLDDPEVLRILFDVSRASARGKTAYNMDYYFVGDEGSLGSYTDPAEFCWGPQTLAHLRRWLRERYGSLATLNRTWGSAFADWDAVVPLTTDEARRSGRFAPWADHRTYMEVSFANAYATVRRAVLEGDPDGHIALSGTQVTTPYDGCDWYRLDQVVDDFLSYSGGNQWEIHRSFGKPGARVGFWTGYGRSGPAVRHEVWSAAMNNVLFPSLFWSYSIVNPDLTFSRSGHDLGVAFRALRFEGIGKLLMEAERLSDGVAIHYSMPSVHAAGILGHHPNRDEEEAPDPAGRDFPANRDGWVQAIGDLGLSPDFVSAEQVEHGGLSGRRVCILPFSLALSDAEVQAIRSFVEGGGVVIADAAAGLMDEHANWRRDAVLLDLFGITAPAADTRGGAGPRVKGSVTVTDEGAVWGLETADLNGLEAVEPEVRASTGRALVRVGGVDAAIVRKVGAGWTVYLNALMDRYPSLRDKGWGGAAYRTLLARVLAHGGVRPAVVVTDAAGRELPRTQVARYRFASSEVVAVLSGDLGTTTRFGTDGVTAYGDEAKALAPREVVVHLPRAAQVTNARTGESLGTTDTLRTAIVPGAALVLALGNGPRVLRLDGPATARLGEHAAFTLKTSDQARHLLRCHVLSPDGALLPEYAKNVIVEGGSARFVLPSALNDPAGEYRIQATDVLDGSKAEARIRLR